MKWLQWSKSDLATGLGGVEVHARCVARELRSLGVQAEFSSDPADLQNDRWDVIHTHGSGFVPSASSAITVHTLHGTTLGRMAACNEWLWPGGYQAWSRELNGVLKSDVTLSVHPHLSLLKLARTLSKVSEVCWNGWDAGEQQDSESLSPDLSKKISGRAFWIFVGRGEDQMKGADRILKVLDQKTDILLVAAPGAGFESRSEVISTERLNSAQVRTLMSLATGLLMPSRYEGHSLVVLEALAEGLPIVATPVGGVPVLPKEVQGLIVRSPNASAILDGIREVESLDLSKTGRENRKKINRLLLPTWKNVAEIALKSVESALAKRKER